MKVSLVATTVTGMDSIDFSEELFYFWDEWLGVWEFQLGECKVRCGQTSMQWTSVVFLGNWYLLGGNLGLPKFVGYLSLLDAFVSQVSVGPSNGVVPIEL